MIAPSPCRVVMSPVRRPAQPSACARREFDGWPATPSPTSMSRRRRASTCRASAVTKRGPKSLLTHCMLTFRGAVQAPRRPAFAAPLERAQSRLAYLRACRTPRSGIGKFMHACASPCSASARQVSVQAWRPALPADPLPARRPASQRQQAEVSRREVTACVKAPACKRLLHMYQCPQAC